MTPRQVLMAPKFLSAETRHGRRPSIFPASPRTFQIWGAAGDVAAGVLDTIILIYQGSLLCQAVQSFDVNLCWSFFQKVRPMAHNTYMYIKIQYKTPTHHDHPVGSGMGVGPHG